MYINGDKLTAEGCIKMWDFPMGVFPPGTVIPIIWSYYNCGDEAGNIWTRMYIHQSGRNCEIGSEFQCEHTSYLQPGDESEELYYEYTVPYDSLFPHDVELFIQFGHGSLQCRDILTGPSCRENYPPCWWWPGPDICPTDCCICFQHSYEQFHYTWKIKQPCEIFDNDAYECLTHGCKYWVNTATCHEQEIGLPCDKYINQRDCVASDCEWYNEECRTKTYHHQIPLPIILTVSVVVLGSIYLLLKK